MKVVGGEAESLYAGCAIGSYVFRVNKDSAQQQDGYVYVIIDKDLEQKMMMTSFIQLNQKGCGAMALMRFSRGWQ